MPASKTVKWAEAAEARDADTGEVETVELHDGPSQIRLKCLQELKEARAQQSPSGVTFCERALEAAEAAEGEDRLADAEQILELIIGHLQDAMATPEFQTYIANLRAHHEHDKWAGDDARERERRQQERNDQHERELQQRQQQGQVPREEEGAQPEGEHPPSSSLFALQPSQQHG